MEALVTTEGMPGREKTIAVTSFCNSFLLFWPPNTIAPVNSY
jgi:hypothetical protein